MINILIRDVPDVVHAQLVAGAEAAGQSLQRYLLHRLEAQAAQTDIERAIGEWTSLAQARAASTDLSWAAADLIGEARHERDNHVAQVVDDARR